MEHPTPLSDTFGNSTPFQGLLEPIPSTEAGVGPFFSIDYLGMSTCAHDSSFLFFLMETA